MLFNILNEPYPQVKKFLQDPQLMSLGANLPSDITNLLHDYT